jgi:formate hydrogenlyase transcriptional activator
VIERAVIISNGSVLNVPLAELDPNVSIKSYLDRTSSKPVSPENLPQILEETERTQIMRALQEAHGLVSGPDGAAARLGIKRSTLQLRMQKLGIRLSRTAVDDRRRTLQ